MKAHSLEADICLLQECYNYSSPSSDCIVNNSCNIQLLLQSSHSKIGFVLNQRAQKAWTGSGEARHGSK